MVPNWIHYFGYGSLVNRDTRPVDEAASSARLNGWGRVWEHRVRDPNREKLCTSLSIEALPANEPSGIDGVIVRIPEHQLAQLDKREAGYERLALPAANFELPDDFDGDVIMVYRSLPANRVLADKEHPILQSYIDCVLAGYLQRFGEAGLHAMMASTRGWNRPILNDRAAPFYPRWVEVNEPSRVLFDECIERVQ